ncbi:MAG TPA: transferrin receptor-like dimerization domain-containing protein [Rhizomicrobium sp.]|jgi:N-acetylated-alpha-linked acidic dipeptidase|nr:transferrin receptor-like dimerization domain-containing protein [Rhizomicrobium sp.]
MHRKSLLAAASVLCLGTAFAAPSTPPAADQSPLEKSFDAAINPAEIGAWLKLMAAEPNQVGSPHDKTNAEWELAQFKKFGWDAHIEQFQVLYPTPITETVELMGPKPFKATLQEPPIPGDSSATAKDYALPAYLAYQGDGDVTAPMVYVNYGMPDDYKALERMGISVKGAIVIARYGAGWRGLKPKLAQEHGAVGCLIYSDPAQDGYSMDSAYPKGPARPARGIQRGSVVDMTLYAGDPLTPNVGATADAKRLTRETSPVLLKIPALPISYADAQVLLANMTGDVVPPGWRGALPITYRVGPSTAKLHLVVKSDWSLKTIYDVVAMMKGSTYPDQWIVRGNHHDGWVFGASDPLSGQAALLSEAQAIGELVQQGWHPKRTIVYTSWDGEEPGLLGSTEWAETHAAELKQKAVLYINTDNNARGILGVGGNHDFEHFVNQVAGSVIDPETHVSIGDRLRAKLRVDASAPNAKDEDKENAKIAADPTRDFPIEALGSGSDYSAYLEHLGLPAIDVGFGDEGEAGGVYHSRYDTYEHHSRFVDPGFVYDALLAKTVGRMVLRAASTDLPLQQAGDFSDTMAMYLKQIKKLADDKRKAQETQAKLLADGSFQLAADPTKTSGTPTALKPVPKFDFSPLDDATARLAKSAAAYDTAFANDAVGLSPDARVKLQGLMQTIDQTLSSDTGLPGRPWFRNLIYAPGRLTGYGAKTLPGVREAIEDERWDDANQYIKLTANALNAYSARLDQATAVLKGR